jgi:TonB family protein
VSGFSPDRRSVRLQPDVQGGVMTRRILVTALFALVAALSPVAGQEVFRPGDGVTLPIPIREVKPGYTAAAMEARIEGKVGLDIVVLDDGKVGEVKVSQSLDMEYGLDTQAVEATKQWLFKPGTKDGKPVAVRVTLEMTFTLK